MSVVDVVCLCVAPYFTRKLFIYSPSMSYLIRIVILLHIINFYTHLIFFFFFINIKIYFLMPILLLQ